MQDEERQSERANKASLCNCFEYVETITSHLLSLGYPELVIARAEGQLKAVLIVSV